MVQYGLFVRLKAKPGKSFDVERFLREGASAIREEPGTTAWFALKMGDGDFGIFDVFSDESDRQTHLSGKVAAALFEKAPELFAQPPAVEKIDVLAEKMPGDVSDWRTFIDANRL